MEICKRIFPPYNISQNLAPNLALQAFARKTSRAKLRAQNFARKTSRTKIRAKHRAPNFAPQASSTKLRAPSFAHQASRTKLRAPNFAHQTSPPNFATLARYTCFSPLTSILSLEGITRRPAFKHMCIGTYCKKALKPQSSHVVKWAEPFGKCSLFRVPNNVETIPPWHALPLEGDCERPGKLDSPRNHWESTEVAAVGRKTWWRFVCAQAVASTVQMHF